ncbi:MAG: lactonase family protein, partial [Chloroflexales bacterium]|nr:lactonase family protein [Chloroflexales bacterium]
MKSTLANTAASVEQEFVYTLEDRDTDTNRIHGYLVNGATGALTLLGDPVDTGFPGDNNTNDVLQRLAFHPATRRLFAINGGASHTLSVFDVDLFTGQLTRRPELTQNLGAGGWNCVVVHPSGSPVLVGGAVAVEGSVAGRVLSYVFNASGELVAQGGPADAGEAIPYSCRLSQDGQYFYAGGSGPDSIAGFRVDALTGSLSPLPGSPFAAGVSYPLAYATDDQGR